jgi:hypothetical protein
VELAVRTVSVRRVTARNKLPRKAAEIGTPGIVPGFQAHPKRRRHRYTAISVAWKGGGYDHPDCNDLSFCGRLPGNDRDHCGGSRLSGASDCCGEAAPDSEPGRCVRVPGCVPERARQQALRVVTGPRTPLSDQARMRKDAARSPIRNRVKAASRASVGAERRTG